MTKTQTSITVPWNPSATELASILASMRPIVDRFADRDQRRMAEQMGA